MKRILITLNDVDVHHLENEAKKRKMPLASVARIFLVDGIQVNRSSRKVIITPTPDNPMRENIPNQSITCGDYKGFVWQTQLKGYGEYFIFPPICNAVDNNKNKIINGIWIIMMAAPLGDIQKIIFKGGLPDKPQILRAGDLIYFFFQSNVLASLFTS